MAAAARYYFFTRQFIPTAIVSDAINTRRGLKWGVPAMLLAVSLPVSRTPTATVIDPFTAERDGFAMDGLLIGYARVSTEEQDLTAQQNALERLGVRSSLIYTDHGLTGTNRARPGLREALAACRAGDTLVVAKLDRLARSLRDAKDIIDELTAKDVKLSLDPPVELRL